MARYELADEQVRSLLTLIGNAQIKGSEAAIIIGLTYALSSPVKEKKDDAGKGERKPINKGEAGHD